MPQAEITSSSTSLNMVLAGNVSLIDEWHSYAAQYPYILALVVVVTLLLMAAVLTKLLCCQAEKRLGDDDSY
jgi:hypothetical protein